MALYYHWEVTQIKIYPLGGCVKLDEELNRPIKEEFLILIFGPIFQIIFYIILFFLHQENMISYQNFSLIKQYHYLFLYLNLLPIYPLDGGKLLYLVFQKALPYQKASYAISIFSYLFVIAFLSKNLSIVLIFFFSCTIFDIYNFFKKIPYLYHRFLLERYLHHYNFKKIKKVKSIKNLYKGYRHLIKERFKYKTEKEYLKEYFQKEG